MSAYLDQRVRDLQDEAAVAEARAEGRTVTVELSEPLAWLVRDLIGCQSLATRVQQFSGVGGGFNEDMARLGAVLGYRNDEASVSRWALRAAERLVRG
jgi:hypothetical protein